MKELLRQLTTFAPALIAQMKGNPVALEEFTKGYQSTLAQLEEKKLREQQMGMATEDRQRAIARQGEQDRIAGEERDYGKYQDALKALSEFVPMQETMGGAESMTQSVMAGVPPSVRERVAPIADAQLRQMPSVFSARRVAEFKKWVGGLGDSEFVAQMRAEGADADISQHLQKKAPRMLEIMRQQRPDATAFSLNDVYEVAGMLKPAEPQARPRTPAAAGSFEDYVAKKYGEAPTPEQIIEARKVYNQADDRAPRVTVNTGGVDSGAMARFNSIASAYDRSPLIRAADRTLILDDAAQNIRIDPSNAAAQMALAYGYIQALDTYQSAVREGELGNLGSLGTVWQQLGVSANKLITTGAFMPPDVALQIANSADQMVQVIEKGRNQKMAEFASRAKVNKVDDMWSEFVAGMPTRSQAGSAAPAPMQKAIPGIRGGVAESTDGGKTWKRVK